MTKLSELSSPNDDSDLSDSGSDSPPNDQSTGLGESYWMLRLTPQEMYKLEDVEAYFQQYFNSFLICEEKTPKLHFHCILVADPEFEELHEGDVRGIVKSFLDVYWPVKSKGWGIAQYHLQQSNKPSKAFSYTLKQKGRKLWKGFSDDEINAYIESSFPKNDRNSFVDLFRTLKKDFHEDPQMQIIDFMDRFGVLKSNFDQMVNPAHAYGYALSAQIKRDNRESRSIMRRYLENL